MEIDDALIRTPLALPLSPPASPDSEQLEWRLCFRRAIREVTLRRARLCDYLRSENDGRQGAI